MRRKSIIAGALDLEGEIAAGGEVAKPPAAPSRFGREALG